MAKGMSRSRKSGAPGGLEFLHISRCGATLAGVYLEIVCNSSGTDGISAA